MTADDIIAAFREVERQHERNIIDGARRTAALAAICDRAGITAFRAGDRVQCLDDTHGAHFLVAGHIYVVASTQVDSYGMLRVVLLGMHAAWEPSRFKKVRPS